MKLAYKVLCWGIGLIIILAGLGLMTDFFLPGLIYISIGLFLIPNITRKIEKLVNRKIHLAIKWVIVIILFATANTLWGTMEDIVTKKEHTADKKIDIMVRNAEELIDKGSLDEATSVLHQARAKYSNRLKNPANTLLITISRFKSIKYAEKTLISMSDEEFRQLLDGNLNKEYIKQETLNKKFIASLKELSPQRKALKKQKEQEIKKSQEELLVKQRKDKIEKQFSAWDGSHYNLTKTLKKNMHDPSSYEHVSTKYWDMKNYITVQTTFRGKNMFGAKILNTFKAKVSLNGIILEIVD